jgi:hypothetical protein
MQKKRRPQAAAERSGAPYGLNIHATGRGRVEGGRGRRWARHARAPGRARQLRGTGGGAARRRRVRARRGPPSVGRARCDRSVARVLRLVRRAPAGSLAGVAPRRRTAARVESVQPARRRLRAVLCRGCVDLPRQPARRACARGLSRPARCRAADRRLHGVRSCDGAGDVVPVPSDLARHSACECLRRSDRRGGSDARAPHRRPCAVAACARRSPGTGERLRCLARRPLRAGVRRPPGSADHLAARGGASRGGRPRSGRLCLASWRASAS